MGFMDKDKLSDAAEQHGDKIDQGIDKGSDVADEKTGGKHSEQIDQGADRLREGVDDLGGGDAQGADGNPS